MNAIGLLSAALEDKTMPIEEVSQACQLMIESASSKYQLTNAYFAIEKPLFKNWPHASVSYFTKGRFYFEFAWRQRGGGYADSISSNAWASFAANLAIAEKAYQKAWSLNPKDVRIPVQMIEMAVSQQKKRPEMELWFQRAMQLNTNNYEACLKKLRYLNPKWYGTREDMIKFGRQCVASTNWGGRVPMILVEAHSQLAGYFPRDQRDRYWQIPGVWPDIKSAYEKIFQLNPEAKNFRSYYANYAFKCGQWAEFLNQIKLLQKSEEGLNPEFWGTREKFDEMVQFATEHSQKN
jgi:hypothetical protein